MTVFAGYVGCQRLTNQEQEIQLVTARVTRGDVVRGIDATGRLEAAELSPRTFSIVAREFSSFEAARGR
jgi:hypothetical protein